MDDEEMHRTFNMDTGFVVALSEGDAEAVVEESEGARIVGHVAEGEECVAILGMELE